MSALLEVGELAVCYGGEVAALRGVSLSVSRGEALAIVGESGSGKSTLALCLAGLIQPPEAQGSVRFDGQELLGATPETLRSLRWAKVAIGLQAAPFNPVARIGDQLVEPLRARRRIAAPAARKRAQELAAEVLLDPGLLDRYPHQLSGGERRRAMLAMVLCLDPELVVLDEPVEGLDAAMRTELMDRVATLAQARGFALVVVTHTLPDAQRVAPRCLVLYAGQAMEAGPTSRVMGDPAHPYSWALVNAYPQMATTKELRPIRGLPPDARAVPTGCPFHPRCSQSEAVCRDELPALAPSRGRDVACHFGGLKTVLSAVDIHKSYRLAGRLIQALAGTSVMVLHGEAVGIVGPSGSGKTTLARIMAGHLAPDSGRVELDGERLPASWGVDTRALRRDIQLVMQDPWDALSPRLSVAELVREPLDIWALQDPPGRRLLVAEMLDRVGLPSSGSFMDALAHELSGGQLQRVALARALVVGPRVLVADEPTSMLDASEQARLLVALRERQAEMGLALIVVSHDIAIVRKVTDRIVVLEAGRVVEEGSSARVSSAPRSPTARRLVEAAPAFTPVDEGSTR